MITLYFVRHGQTVWNESGRYQGSTEVALSALGKKQAKLTAHWFEGISLNGIISSSLGRAMETAKEIAKLKSMNVEVIDALQELHFGDWEGKTFEEIEHCWPGMIEEMYHHPELLQLPHGESFADLQRRTIQAVEEIIDRGDNKTYVIVSHGAAIRAIICGLFIILRIIFQSDLQILDNGILLLETSVARKRISEHVKLLLKLKQNGQICTFTVS